MSAVGCLDDATIYDLVRGGLDGEQVAAIDGHVDSCPLCREVVVGAARTIAGGAPTLRPGEQVGRYVILSVLGSGGFGIVYRAFDGLLDRPVALKLMKKARDDTLAERLLREAQAMAKLSHPNVVTVYEVGTAKSATFIAMELVEGVDLRGWLAAARRAPLSIRDVFVQAAEGLAAAHDAGLTHRDFKPDNVIVGSDGRARVTDFGLARGMGEVSGVARLDELEAPELSVSLTVTGQLLGTPAYMAPEQLEGAPGDALSDQYSFCVSLFEALYGERPYQGRAVAELLEAVRGGHPRRTTANVPGWLDRALSRGLSRDPARRHPSMRALVAALKRDPGARWRRGFGAVAAAVAVAALSAPLYRAEPSLCTGGSALARETWNDAHRARVMEAFDGTGLSFARRTFAAVDGSLEAWRAAWAKEHTTACEATRVRGEQSEPVMDARMACLGRQRVAVEALVAALSAADDEGVARAVEAVSALERPAACGEVASSSPPEPPPAVSADVAEIDGALARARALLATGKLARAREAADVLVGRAASIGYDPVLAAAEGLARDARVKTGELAEAESHALESLWAARRARDVHGEIEAWLGLVAVAGTRGDYEAAEVSGRHAESMLSHTPDIGASALLHSLRGVIHTHLGRFDSAEAHLFEAMKLRVGVFGSDSVEVAKLHTNLGNLARARGDYARAAEEHERARAIDRALLGDDHPNEARHRHNLARVRLLQGDTEEARSLYLSALALERAIFGDAHPEVGITHNSLGLLFVKTGDTAKAQRHFEQALVAFGARRPLETAMTKLNLGTLFVARGAFSTALAHLEPARASLSAHLGESHLRVVEAEEAIANAQAGMGDRSGALTTLRRARVLAASHGEVVLGRIDRALARLTAAPSPVALPVRTGLVAPEPPPAPLPQPSPQPPLPRPQPAPGTSTKPAPPPGAYMPGTAWD